MLVKKMSTDGSVSPVSYDEEVFAEPSVGETSTSAGRTSIADEVGEAILSKPKRPLSAYNLFFQDYRQRLLETLPSRFEHDEAKRKRSHGKINFKDLAKTIGAKWKKITPEEKEKYELIAAKGRAKYMKLAKQWKKQQRKLGQMDKRRKQQVQAREKLLTAKTKVEYVPSEPVDASTGLHWAMQACAVQRNHTRILDAAMPGSFWLPARNPTVSAVSETNRHHRSVVDEVSPYPGGSTNGKCREENVCPHSMPSMSPLEGSDSPQRPGEERVFQVGGSLARMVTDQSPNLFSLSNRRKSGEVLDSQPPFFPCPSREVTQSKDRQVQRPYLQLNEAALEPIPCSFHENSIDETYQHTQTSMQNLASAMGKECVDLFVELFGAR